VTISQLPQQAKRGVGRFLSLTQTYTRNTKAPYQCILTSQMLLRGLSAQLRLLKVTFMKMKKRNK